MMIDLPQAAIRSPEDLFPRQLFSVESLTAPLDDSALRSAERELVRNAVARRRGEFAAGRYCARRALARFDVRGPAILRDAYGAPLWPGGLCGSISHTRDYILCVVALNSLVTALGVDVDSLAEPFPESALPQICRPEELDALHRLPSAWRGVSAYALFSAKESIYKAVYSASRQRLRFCDARVWLDLPHGLFQAQLTRSVDENGRRVLSGRVGFNERHIFSATWWLRERVRAAPARWAA